MVGKVMNDAPLFALSAPVKFGRPAPNVPKLCPEHFRPPVRNSPRINMNAISLIPFLAKASVRATLPRDRIRQLATSVVPPSSLYQTPGRAARLVFYTFIPLLFLPLNKTAGCFWVTGTTYDAKPITTGLPVSHRLRMAIQRNIQVSGAEMEAALRHATNYNDRSDYSVALARLGRNDESVALLKQLESEQPGNYFIAANLGTALELSGQNEEALRWIKEGLKRNPDAHHGTEWLHAKILEAKIARQKDPEFFKHHSVLELDPAHISGDLKLDGKSFASTNVTSAIQDQLEERLQFVKPPDEAVASLFFDYAAMEYGYPGAKVDIQNKIYDQKISWRKTKRTLKYSFFAAVALGFLVFLYRRKILTIK